MLILKMRINVGDINFQHTLLFIVEKLVWVSILLCATFFLKLIFNVLVGSLHEDLGLFSVVDTMLR